MKRVAVAVMVALVLAGVTATPVFAGLPGIPQPGHGWLGCGDMEPATYEIRAKNAACSTARKVARKAFRKMSKSRRFGRTRARGYRCARRVSLYDGSVYWCRKGRKQVRFYIGG